MPIFVIALGLSLVGGLGGLLVASGVLLIKDSARSKLIPWLVSYAVGALLGVAMPPEHEFLEHEEQQDAPQQRRKHA